MLYIDTQEKGFYINFLNNANHFQLNLNIQIDNVVTGFFQFQLISFLMFINKFLNTSIHIISYELIGYTFNAKFFCSLYEFNKKKKKTLKSK